MKVRFTAFSINSIDMKMVMMLRLSRKPSTPRQKSTALRIKYQESGTMLALLPSQHHRTHDRNQDEDGGDFKRQQEIAEQEASDEVRFAKIGRAYADRAKGLIVPDHDPANQSAQHKCARYAYDQGDFAAG